MTSLKKPKKNTRSGGALTFIVACLLISGVFRFGGGESAIAKEVASLASSQTPNSTKGDSPAKAESVTCQPTQKAGPLLKAIRDRQTQLDEREAKIADRIQALNVAEMKLKENTAVLLKAEKQLAATLTIANTAAEDDLMRLTAVYENMKAKNAANLFGEMAPEFAAGFLARMRSDSAAGIMSNLTPGKAYTISLILAGRNARAPSN